MADPVSFVRIFCNDGAVFAGYPDAAIEHAMELRKRFNPPLQAGRILEQVRPDGFGADRQFVQSGLEIVVHATGGDGHRRELLLAQQALHVGLQQTSGDH